MSAILYFDKSFLISSAKGFRDLLQMHSPGLVWRDYHGSGQQRRDYHHPGLWISHSTPWSQIRKSRATEF